MDNAIEVKNLFKEYKYFKLDGISFSVPKGAIVGLVGQNGAGKTTVMNLLLNTIKRSSGEIKIFGLDNIKDETEIKKHISFVADYLYLPYNFTIKKIENILKYMYDNWNSSMFAEYLKKFGLKPEFKPMGLSKGMIIKLSIAIALSHDAKLFLFDEAASALDPAAREDFFDIIRDLVSDGEHTVLISSNVIGDIEKISDYVIMLHSGKIKFYEDIETLKNSYKILHCTKDEFGSIGSENIIACRSNAYGINALVKNYTPDITVKADRASAEDIVLMIIKNEMKEVNV